MPSLRRVHLFLAAHYSAPCCTVHVAATLKEARVLQALFQCCILAVCRVQAQRIEFFRGVRSDRARLACGYGSMTTTALLTAASKRRTHDAALCPGLLLLQTAQRADSVWQTTAGRAQLFA